MEWLQQMIKQNANDARIPAQYVRPILWGPPLFALVVLALHSINESFYLWFVREWMPVEDMQFIFFALGSLFAFLIALRLWRDNQRVFAVIYMLFGLGLFFISGEEVSWGQPIFVRLFSWWPNRAALRDINVQGETTIHNMRTVGWIFNWFQLLLALYGTLSPLLFAIPRLRADSRLRWLALPVITLPAFLVMLAYMLIHFFVAPYNGLIDSVSFLRYKEVGELALAFGLWLFVFMNWRWVSWPSEQRVTMRAGNSTDALIR